RHGRIVARSSHSGSDAEPLELAGQPRVDAVQAAGGGSGGQELVRPVAGPQVGPTREGTGTARPPGQPGDLTAGGTREALVPLVAVAQAPPVRHEAEGEAPDEEGEGAPAPQGQ